MQRFENLKAACEERFGEDRVRQIAEDQMEIAVVNDAGEAMFPLYVGFHSEKDLELSAILFQVPEADAEAFMAQCSTLNAQYPWVKFYLDDRYFCAGMDLLLYADDVEDKMSMVTALLQVICANLPGLLG